MDGEANAELVKTIAKALGIPKRQVSLVLGETGRLKVVEVRGLDEPEVRARIVAALTH